VIAAVLLVLLLAPLVVVTGYGLALAVRIAPVVAADIAAYLTTCTKERR
jgi:hypothetical protein